MSQFDPEAFLDSTMDQPLTKRPPIMPGSYSAEIGEPKMREWASKDGTKSGLALDVPLTLQLTPEEAERVGQPSVGVTDSLFLDIGSDGKSLDVAPGKNRRLRAYREATGLNNPGDKFSVRMLQGRQVKVAVKHEPAKDSDDIYERVGAVAKA